jgi:uncharacterized protein YjbI with pentapeptide repeats
MNAKEKGRALVGGARSRKQVESLSGGGRLDLTYRKISSLNLYDKSLELSLFTGAILEKCHFERVSFDRCDFAGTKFADCTFIDCSFVPVEVRSCFFSRCTFRSCDLRGSQWTSTVTNATTFDGCDFREATIRESVFSNSKLLKCNFIRNSITLDRFNGCSFREIDFGDCTALFLFFDRCKFERCRFSTECIGYTFGLSLEDIESSELTYLSESQAKPTEGDLVDTLIANYLERNWFAGACALELNFRRLNPFISLRNFVSRIGPEAAKHKRVDWDELQFLILILQRLQSENRLPLLGIWPLYRFVNESYVTLQQEFPASRSFTSAPELALSRLEKLLDEMLQELAELSVDTLTPDVELEMVCHFKRRPRAPLDKLLPGKLFNIFGATRSNLTLVSSKKGSWIEVWQLSAGAFAAVQTSLVAVNGVLGQVVKFSKQLKTLSNLFSPAPNKAKRTPTRRKSKKIKPARRADLNEVLVQTLSDQKLVLSRRVPLLSDVYLARLDRTILVILSLPDQAIHDFEDYSEDVLQVIEVKRRNPRRRHS